MYSVHIELFNKFGRCVFGTTFHNVPDYGALIEELRAHNLDAVRALVDIALPYSE